MKILDEKNVEVTNPDLTLGYIKDDTETIHHDAIEAEDAVENQVHYEVIKKYENGGQDLKEVVDVQGHPAIEAKDAWDESVQIQRYVLYTQEELDALKKAQDELEKAKSLPSIEDRLKATEDALMTMMLGGTSNV